MKIDDTLEPGAQVAEPTCRGDAGLLTRPALETSRAPVYPPLAANRFRSAPTRPARCLENSHDVHADPHTDRRAGSGRWQRLLGHGTGATGIALGEVCFNTAMTGHQEILADPSYAGQVVCFTFPHVGNVGANGEDEEAACRRPAKRLSA